MERELLTKYLKFLAQRADALVTKDIVEDYDVAVLKRELSDFKARLGSDSTGSTALDQSIASLELRASEKDAEGDQVGLLKLSMKLLFGQGLAWKELERARQMKVKAAIADFRNDVSHIHFALDV